jgi:hypothetical protein
MSQVFVRFGSSFAQLVLLFFLFLCVGHPRTATCQSGGSGASAAPTEESTATPHIGTQTASREKSDSKSKKGSFILAEVEPLLLLLFGLLLFSVATGIKLKLSRVNRASGQYLEPLVSGSAGRPETRS